ncbi:MAG: TVP38/TMEM64 family protein [Hoeflea sp.]|nr:TVP38/TMEM64 family protein [Alphaproteobacteria bacterium]MBV1724656.1 TVP38/TMEM64 family protein [Hoeflea sp.]MBU4544237.1 TVP38/TMEM64 family protein [Alphaproteobacteria bacterium]MBU4550526.1 TVP38/TMEM64 family protein [Alphaproteobacteria bacterium]MBV1760676.1 TVP38/TMEM64 family protein [Hoeflea sp.]
MDNTMPDTRQSRPAPETAPDKGAASAWRRYLPIAVIAAGLAAGYAAGLQEYLSLSVLAEQRESIKAFVAERQILSILGYFVLYTAAVAFAFPAASVLTIFAGFVFGWWVAGILTVFAATLGATAIFLAARSAFGDVLRRRAGPFAAKLADGFTRDAFGYLLVLRLAPVFPFLIINIAPAFFDIRLRTYVAATFLGIIPGTLAYSWLGQGLDSVIAAADAAGREISVSDLVTPEITIAFLGLAIVASIPTLIRKFRKRA